MCLSVHGYLFVTKLMKERCMTGCEHAVRAVRMPAFSVLLNESFILAGLTPTTVLKDLEERAVVQHNLMSGAPAADGAIPANDVSHLHHVTDGSTVDRPHAIPEAVAIKADCNVALAMSGAVAPPREPRNAQNPTVERNTHWSSSEELAVEGNTLVVRRPGCSKDTGSSATPSNSNDANAAANQNVFQPLNRAGNGRPSSMLRSAPQHRISFVQNPVDIAVGALPSASSGPKRQNVPGNGRTDASCPAAGQVSPSLKQLPIRQCEVVLLDGAAGTTVVRPTSLPMETGGHNQTSNVEPQIDTGARLGAGAPGPRQVIGDLGHQSSSLELSQRAGGSSSSATVQADDHYLIGGRTGFKIDEVQQPFNDNLGFESSTSPRFEDYPAASHRRVW